eukprot:c8308_g1_i1 orf=173-1756(+)
MAAAQASMVVVVGGNTINTPISDLAILSASDKLIKLHHQKPSKSLRSSFASTSLSAPFLKSSKGFHVLKRAPLLAVRCSTTADSPASALRRILESPGLHQGPACHDALSAKLVESAGFTFTFMSGFAVAASRLALPDTGLISYGEMVDQGTLITSAVSIPVIGDGDNGYGNALNVKRTVKGYIKAGFAGILLEDQVSPKACGHTKGRKVISREDAIMRIKAAVDARKESSSDIVIVARTDACQAVSLDEALWRAQAFADAGADVLFVDALSSKEEMQDFCNIAPGTPKMANMLEGGGKTPILTPRELEDLGFKIVAYPLSLIGVSISAMQDALLALKSGRMPPPSDLPSFEEIKTIVGFNNYYEEEKKYSTSQSTLEEPSSSDDSLKQEIHANGDKASTPLKNSSSIDVSSQPETDEGPALQNPEAELVIPYVLEDSKDGDSTSSSKIWSRTLRVKVTANSGVVKLDVRIPAGFLDGLAKIIPGVAGVNVAGLLDESAYKFKGNLESGQELLDINDGRGDRIQIFLE